MEKLGGRLVAERVQIRGRNAGNNFRRGSKRGARKVTKGEGNGEKVRQGPVSRA